MKKAALIYIFLILVLIVMANNGSLPVWISWCSKISYGDTVGHFLLFGAFSMAWTLATRMKRVTVFSKSLFLGTVIAICFVTLEEFSQLFITSRTFSPSDLIANSAGIFVIGQLLCTWLLKKRLVPPSHLLCSNGCE